MAKDVQECRNAREEDEAQDVLELLTGIVRHIVAEAVEDIRDQTQLRCRYSAVREHPAVGRAGLTYSEQRSRRM